MPRKRMMRMRSPKMKSMNLKNLRKKSWKAWQENLKDLKAYPSHGLGRNAYEDQKAGPRRLASYPNSR
jgi:hypothetical protein